MRGKPENRKRRVVGMYRQNRPAFLGDGRYLLQKCDEIVFELLRRKAVVARKHFADIAYFKPHFAAGENVDNGTLKGLLLRIVKGVEKRLGLCDLFRRTLRGRAVALQDENVERRELGGVETQALRAVGKAKMQVGANPVENGHKVVDYLLYAAGAQIAYALLVVFQVPQIVARSKLNVLAHGKRLHNVPFEAVGRRFGLVLFYFFDSPKFAVGYVVERAVNACRSALPDKRQRHDIVVAVPSKTFF